TIGLGYAVVSDEGDAAFLEAGAPVNGARTSLFAEAANEDAEPQLPLTLTASRQAWLEARGADGTIFRSRTMAAGEVYHPRIGAGWTVSARDGSAFIWHVGDIEIGRLAEEASAVYAISVDGIAQQAQALAAPALAAVGEQKPSQ
ncbi:MAG: hypothetical protein AAGK23_13785, partial [Pseudomonadota bacterium]